MNDLATLARLIENLIRFGTVAEVQLKPPRVKIRSGAVLTRWLPWLAIRAGQDQIWNPPTVDEQVVLLSPSGQLGNGVALTGLFSNQHPANGDQEGLHRCSYRDGTVLEYDAIAHHLRAVLPAGGSVELICDGGLHIVGPILHQGDYTHQGAYLQTGSQVVDGQIETTGDVVASGISLVEHPHIGNLGAPTSPPQ